MAVGGGGLLDIIPASPFKVSLEGANLSTVTDHALLIISSGLSCTTETRVGFLTGVGWGGVGCFEAKFCVNQ